MQRNARALALPEKPYTVSCLRHSDSMQSELETMSESIGHVWLAGGNLDWSTFYRDETRQRVPLPTYPFEPKRYWVAPPQFASTQKHSIDIEYASPMEEIHHLVSEETPTLDPSLATLSPMQRSAAQALLTLWKHSLGIDTLSLYDNFFDLGGDSLLAVQLLPQLRDILKHTHVNVNTLLHAPTIIQLLTLAEHTAPHQATLPTPLVILNAGKPDKKPPLFLAHPVGGHVYFYYALARRLHPEQPVYGIQAQGIDGQHAPQTDLKAMASDYVEAIRNVQPQGPYYLGGSSLGGTIAFEMAQQLHAQGQTTALLYMVDTPGPGHMPERPLETDAEILTYLLDISGGDAQALAKLQALEPAAQLHYFLDTVWGKLMAQHEVEHGHHIEDLQRLLHLFKANQYAMFHYEPTPWPGALLFFTAQEKYAYLATTPEKAWTALANQVEVHEISGNHITMNHSPHVDKMAQILQARLDRIHPC